MSEDTRHTEGLDRYAESLVRFKARQLSRRADFSPSDEEDLRQELWLYVLSHLPRFDPQRSSLRTFVNRLVHSAVATILRSRNRQKRALGRATVSLESTVIQTGGEPLPAFEAVSADDMQRRIGSQSRDSAELYEDAEAVQSAIASMPPHLRRVVHHLMSGMHASVACECGLTRRQVRTAKQRIRELLEQAGFEEKRRKADRPRLNEHT